jgi:hypothetical protein
MNGGCVSDWSASGSLAKRNAFEMCLISFQLEFWLRQLDCDAICKRAAYAPVELQKRSENRRWQLINRVVGCHNHLAFFVKT